MLEADAIEITQAMIDAAKNIDDTVSDSLVQKILEVGLPYRMNSIMDVSKVVKNVPDDVIDEMLDAAISAIE